MFPFQCRCAIGVRWLLPALHLSIAPPHEIRLTVLSPALTRRLGSTQICSSNSTWCLYDPNTTPLFALPRPLPWLQRMVADSSPPYPPMCSIQRFTSYCTPLRLPFRWTTWSPPSRPHHNLPLLKPAAHHSKFKKLTYHQPYTPYPY